MRTQFVNRIRIVAALVVLSGIFLIFRLYSLQIVHGAEFRERAEGQYAVPSNNYFDRGGIFFSPRKGAPLSAATLDTGFTLTIIPDAIVNPAATYAALSAYLGLDSRTFLEKAAKKGDPYEELARRVPAEVGTAIIAADIPGVRLYRERWRTYPGGSVAAHTIGFLGYGDGGVVLSGQYGLERFYDDALTKPNTGLYVNFFADIFANLHATLTGGNGQAGGADIITAIEPSVQAFLEDTLAKYQEEWHAREAGGIVMDPNTGAMIALATLPTFDPNDFSDADPAVFSNSLVERVYEFGSIMKPLTVAAGIDAGVITPETTYNDKGFAVYDGLRINNYDLKGRGSDTTMQQVLSESLNTGAAHIAVDMLGSDAFRSYLDAFGIREGTGIDLPNEAEPLSSNLDSPRSIEYATAAFGQGIAVTPIAMARSLATLANGGVVPSPHVALALHYPGGFDKRLARPPEKQAISKESAETVTRMLVKLVDEALRGGTVAIPELSVAAKTGTAQIAKESERGYYDDRYLHSFFGYFPAYDAKFLVFFYAVEPQGARYSSETLTTPFIESVRFLSTYYDVKPDRAAAEAHP